MPITDLRLKNFKCFADTGQIPIRPLTVIFGKNNTGKSSILQGLFLLRQTLDAPEYGHRLTLRGDLYPVGSYADIVHGHVVRKNIVMEISVATSSARGSIELEFHHDSKLGSAQLAGLRVKAQGEERLEIRRGRGAGGPFELVIGDRVEGLARDADFQFPATGVLPRIGEEPAGRGRPSGRRKAAREAARHLLQELEDDLRRMRALGPFRHPPQRRYEYSGRAQMAMDISGQNVVDALIEDATRSRSKGRLLRSVNRWLAGVGRVRLLPLRRVSRAGRLFEVRVRDLASGKWAHFSDVGFGVGQALPVFVEGLRTLDGDLFLVQEPEIHLHPDAQLEMANFLIDLVGNGRRIVAETHSEHILLRLRKAVARSKHNQSPGLDPSQISVLFVSRVGQGRSEVKVLDMDELGQLSNWPEGFMEDATRERLEILDQVAKCVEGGG